MPPRNFSVRTYDELLQEYVAERSQSDYEPVRLGFGVIDADLRGITPGQVCGIAARTAVGKTWLLETILHNFAIRRDAGCLGLTLEMPGLEWAERGLAIFSDVAPERVEEWAKQGELGKHASGFLDRMQHSRVVEDSVQLSQLAAVIQQTRAEIDVPLKLVVIDYLGLLEVPGRDAYERASTIGKQLKQIAKAERVAVVVAMQVSRAGADGAEPVTMAMLRDSGVLEESVDFLLGAWRPGRAPNLSPPDELALRNTMRVAILKNRKGADGRVVDLQFHEDSRRLYDPADPFLAAVS